MPKITKIIKFLFFLAVTFLIFYLIFQKIDYRSLKEVLLNANLFYLVLALLIAPLTLVVSAKKWQSMVKTINYSIDFKESLKIVMAASPLAVITPAKSGDLIRAYYLKDRVPAAQTMGAVITERFIDISVLAFYSFAGAVILGNGLIIKISLSLIFLILLFFLVINKIKLPFTKWQQKIENFLSVSRIFIQQPKKILPVLFYALILWLMSVFLVKILFLALGANIPLFHIVATFPVTIFVGLLPVTIAGMGTRDSAIIYFFSSLAKPSICLGVGFLYSLFGYWFLALLGLPVMKKMLP